MIDKYIIQARDTQEYSVCPYCNNKAKNSFLFMGKRLFTNRKCSSCQRIIEYPLLQKSEQIFLRLGFFSNPIYLPNIHVIENVPFKWKMFLIPFAIFFNTLLNVIYLPFGLIRNNIVISRSKNRYFNGYERNDKYAPYFFNLEIDSLEKGGFPSALLTLHLFNGKIIRRDLKKAEQLLLTVSSAYPVLVYEVALQYYEGIWLPQSFTKAFSLFNLVHTYPAASYYIAYMYFQGINVKKDITMSYVHMKTAEEADVNDKFKIYNVIKKQFNQKNKL